MKIKFLKALIMILIFNFSFINISFSSVDDVLRLHRSLWGTEIEPSPIFLNLISSREFQDQLIKIISSEPQYYIMKEELESSEMTFKIGRYFNFFYDEYVLSPKESTAIEFTNRFVRDLQVILNIRFQDKVVQKLNYMILNVLSPKGRKNACQSYLYSI